MKVASTGFVAEQNVGSGPSAQALLLRALVERGVEIDFFSKPSFVDPRPALGKRSGFRFVPVVNRVSDSFRRRVQRVPVLATVGGYTDSSCYNRLLVECIRQQHQLRSYDLCLWLEDYARGSIRGLPTVSWVQGPPGTDARSVLERRDEILRLSGLCQTLKWTTLARLRLSGLGLPPFFRSDHFVVASQQSATTLCRLYGIEPSCISVVPYAVDLNLFYPVRNATSANSGTLRILWLGRIIPRKRLDLFLDGAAMAIDRGLDAQITIAGGVGFVSGYDRLIRSFRFPGRLEWIKRIARAEVPVLMGRHDVLVQPSDEENFGFAVAEAQACGLPVIVGATNGNADYLCSRDIHLADDEPMTMAAAVTEMARRKRANRLGDFMESRHVAGEHFHIDHVVNRLIRILTSVMDQARGGHR